MDEHRIGLKPILRRVFTPPGQRPIVPVENRYEWLYVYGFVRPTTGQNFWLIMPTVSIAAFNIALQHFSADVAQEPLYLLMDRAGWHVSDKVQVPSHMRLLFQPAYSPELQPAEHLWTLLDEPLINRHFPSLDDLETTVVKQCQALRTQQDRVRSATLFHWWPRMS
jgi:transposase